jgi:hypothetical protein
MMMKTLLIPILAIAFVFSATAQDRPRVQILPGLAQPPVPEPMPDDPEEFFPGGPDGMIMPGFMPDMPGRYQIISAQIQQNGKSVPIVLKLDTQTGQVWQLKSVTASVIHNGKPKPITRLVFEPVDPGDHPQPLPHAEPGAAPGHPPVGRGFVEPDPNRTDAIRIQPAPPKAPRIPRR